VTRACGADRCPNRHQLRDERDSKRNAKQDESLGGGWRLRGLMHEETQYGAAGGQRKP
jgi:hypothetical protein